MATATSSRLLPAAAIVALLTLAGCGGAARQGREQRQPARLRPSPGCDPRPRLPTGRSAGCHPEQLILPIHPAGARYGRTRALFPRHCWERTTASAATSTRRPGPARRRWPTGAASARPTTAKRVTATSSARPRHRGCASVRERVRASSTGTRPRPTRAIERSPASSAARVGPRWSLPPPAPPTGRSWRRNSSARWPASRPESATALARGSAVGNHRGRESPMVGFAPPTIRRRSAVGRRRRALRRGRAGRGTMIARSRARPVSRGRIAGVVAMTMLDVGADVSGSVDRRVLLRVWPAFLGCSGVLLLRSDRPVRLRAGCAVSRRVGVIDWLGTALPVPRRSAPGRPGGAAIRRLAVRARAGCVGRGRRDHGGCAQFFPRYLSVAAGLVVTVAVLALAARDRPWDALETWRWSPLPGTLVLIAVAPCCAYAWTSARATGDARITDDTWGLDHWPAQAALPLAVLMISGLAAGHPSGWRLPAWSAGAAAAWFAIVCWLEPHLVASVSRPWAAATLLWSVAFIAATHARSAAPSPRRPHGCRSDKRPASGEMREPRPFHPRDLL